MDGVDDYMKHMTSAIIEKFKKYQFEVSAIFIIAMILDLCGMELQENLWS